MAQQGAERAIAPVFKTVTAPRSVEDAFRIFTERIGSWWPLESHSMGAEKAMSCGMDGVVGGHLFEELADGTRLNWDEILTWDPPNRLVFTWQLNRTAQEAQNIEVTFAAADEGARVELTRSGCERLGDQAAEVRARYDSGWEFVFVERYGGKATD